jgi:hypothetical protein
MSAMTVLHIPGAPSTSARARLLAALLAAALPACGDDTSGGGGSGGSAGDAASTTVATTGGGGSGGGESACTASPAALADCVDPAAYAEDLAFVADVRPPGSPHWQAVQDLCAERLEALGYEVVLDDYGTGTNVIGRRLGTSAPEQTVVVGAHYDAVEDCPGADDNASGVAATLEIARLLAEVDHERTLVIAFWDEEELGLVGAESYVTDLVAAEEDVVVDFTFDTIGYRSTEPDTQTVPAGFEAVFPEAYAQVEDNEFRGDFVAVIANSLAHDDAVAVAAAADRAGIAQALLEIPDGLETSPAFGDLRRSDHAPFWDAGYPAVFLTDTADFRNDHYHCIGGPDVVADIDVDFAVGVTRAALEAAAIALGM